MGVESYVMDHRAVLGANAAAVEELTLVGAPAAHGGGFSLLEAGEGRAGGVGGRGRRAAGHPVPGAAGGRGGAGEGGRDAARVSGV